MANPSSSKGKIKTVIPKLYDLIESVVYGDVWKRAELSKRDRSLVTISALIGMRQFDQLRSHMEKGLDNGLTPSEISEAITHLALYGGFPASMSAALIARSLFIDRGLIPNDGESP